MKIENNVILFNKGIHRDVYKQKDFSWIEVLCFVFKFSFFIGYNIPYLYSCYVDKTSSVSNILI